MKYDVSDFFKASYHSNEQIELFDRFMDMLSTDNKSKDLVDSLSTRFNDYIGTLPSYYASFNIDDNWCKLGPFKFKCSANDAIVGVNSVIHLEKYLVTENDEDPEESWAYKNTKKD